VVRTKPGHSVAPGELREYLASRFPKFWLPDGFVFVADMPRSSTGKVMKAKLREQYHHWKP
jgi:fatty-acyl-CoA synthase